MLPIGGKPCIQYIVEELASVGVKQILMIVEQNDRSIKDHFDKDFGLNNNLRYSEQQGLLKLLDYEDMDVQLFYTRQSSPTGLGDAISHARHFVNKEPFIVALGDTIIYSEEYECLLKRMLNFYKLHESSLVLGAQEVPLEDVSQYGIIKPKQQGNQSIVEIDYVVEKPPVKTTPSQLAFAARYILPPTIFDALDRTKPGRGGVVQLTDAIGLLIKEGTLGYAVKMTDKEKRYNLSDMGSYYEAFIDLALQDSRYGWELKQYLFDLLGI